MAVMQLLSTAAVAQAVADHVKYTFAAMCEVKVLR
jgi:hypothetical protein